MCEFNAITTESSFYGYFLKVKVPEHSYRTAVLSDISHCDDYKYEYKR
jgi:hypothetical protein